MKSFFWAILIFIGLYLASSISGKKQAEDLLRAEAARNTTKKAENSQDPVTLAYTVINESKNHGLPRKVMDGITLIDIEFKDSVISSKYIIDRPASMPLPKNTIIEAKNEALMTFKNEPMCKTNVGRKILQSGINVQENYFLIGGKKPSFSITLGIKNC